MSPESQNARILAALKKGREITPLQALHEFGSLRLGARIFNLREMGHDIVDRRVEVAPRVRVAAYRMGGK